MPDSNSVGAEPLSDETQQEDEHEPWVDTPLDAARRRAFDHPTIDNLRALEDEATSSLRAQLAEVIEAGHRANVVWIATEKENERLQAQLAESERQREARNTSVKRAHELLQQQKRRTAAAEAETARLREALERLAIEARMVAAIAEADYGMTPVSLRSAIAAADESLAQKEGR